MLLFGSSDRSHSFALFLGCRSLVFGRSLAAQDLWELRRCRFLFQAGIYGDVEEDDWLVISDFLKLVGLVFFLFLVILSSMRGGPPPMVP